MIDAVNQFWKVCENGDRRSLTSTGLTYFYLCNVWNTCGRPISFRRQNNLICSELNISKPTMERHRNFLKQCGLIDFFSKGKGDPNITYRIIDVFGSEKGIKYVPQPPDLLPDSSKKILLPEVKKEKFFTTPVTSSFTTSDAIKQSTELFVLVNEEVKNFYYLKNLFFQDAGLRSNWVQKAKPPDEFEQGLMEWMAQNHGKVYPNFEDLRRHFLFWMPNYKIESFKKQYNEHNNGKTAGKPGRNTQEAIYGSNKNENDYASGF